MPTCSRPASRDLCVPRSSSRCRSARSCSASASASSRWSAASSSVKMGLGTAVHPAHARRPRAQLVATPPHQGAARTGHQRPARPARPHDDLGGRRPRPGAGHAGVVCARFESPVCHELRLTLREMELGLSRHDALENMKLRTDIDDLVTFSVVLSQADALGLADRTRPAGTSRRDARQAPPACP